MLTKKKTSTTMSNLRFLYKIGLYAKLTHATAVKRERQREKKKAELGF